MDVESAGIIEIAKFIRTQINTVLIEDNQSEDSEEIKIDKKNKYWLENKTAESSDQDFFGNFSKSNNPTTIIGFSINLTGKQSSKTKKLCFLHKAGQKNIKYYSDRDLEISVGNDDGVTILYAIDIGKGVN